ncbi:MAG: type II toxin-antitoxin system VapC family toxin [Actinobacteria bacterium]|nr:type II toxin-antitoxin system VapC family toxin [Actinomycetota bacterium]
MVEFLAPGLSGESADRLIGGLGWKSPLELIAPDLLLLETASALRKLAMLKSISDAAADRAVSRLQEIGMATITTAVLLSDAWALRKKLTIYDAVYVALAKNLVLPLVTADARLVRAIKGTTVKALLLDDPKLKQHLDVIDR